MRLLGLTDFKARAGIQASDDDVLLGKLIEAVSARIELALDRTLTKAVYTETLKPIGRCVSLKAYPVDTSVSLTLTDYNFVVPSTDYEVDQNNGLVVLLWRSFSYQHYRSVTVAYTGGYAESGTGSEKSLLVPDDLKDACAKQAKYEFQNRDIFGQQSVSMDGSSVSLAEAKFLPVVKEIIKLRRRWTLE